MPEAMARVKREKPIAMCMLAGVVEKKKVEACCAAQELESKCCIHINWVATLFPSVLPKLGS
ncbi:hypothetical protein TWF506_010271 [Arthrobotrys conoides]|uniref:Uncharacterized protein n=1 Tax=Arthrobotrys conoides TaxID=74498 RepID=A0AAN8RV06_9PEZI